MPTTAGRLARGGLQVLPTPEIQILERHGAVSPVLERHPTAPAWQRGDVFRMLPQALAGSRS